MNVTNGQLALLLPVVERELKNDPSNIEWIDLYERLLRMKEWREHKDGPILNPIPKKVWGRDYV